MSERDDDDDDSASDDENFNFSGEYNSHASQD